MPSVFARALTLAVLGVLVWEAGFSGVVDMNLRWITGGLVAAFVLEQVVNWRRAADRVRYWRRWGFHLAMAGVVGVTEGILLVLQPWEGEGGGRLTLLAHGLVQGGMLVSLGLRALRHVAQGTRLRVRPGWLFMGSFLLVVVVGALLLKLPRAVRPGVELSWLDALFTSTSAVCVTGLAVQNTADFFSTTGQVILLGLIQVGGLGIMTLTFFLGAVIFREMSLHDRQALGEMISEKHLGQVSGSMRFIVVFTFVAEALGAVALFAYLPEDRGLPERVFQAVFHSVSAFCNAGFSTLPNGLADDWVRGNAGVQMVICGLIVAGGLGAGVVRDAMSWGMQWLQRQAGRRQDRPRLRVHTRLVLLVTGLLLVGGAGAVWLSEFGLREGGESNGGTVLTALFHSVTARTAGFNTVDMGAIGPVTVHLVVFLMLIGGSPGGTAGGVRTTVFAVASMHIWNALRGVPELVMFRRRLPADAGSRALAVLVLTMGWLFVNFAVLRQVQPEVTDTRLVFELVSAFATVGLSMNLTPELTEAARWVIIVNMFVGRIGLFTVISTLAPLAVSRATRRPLEDIVLT